MSVRRLFEDGSSEVLPDMSYANVGDVVRIEDDGTADVGSWTWYELTAKEPINTLSMTDKVVDYVSRQACFTPSTTRLETNLLFATVSDLSDDKRVLVYLNEEDKSNDNRFVEFVVWMDDLFEGIYGVIFNPLNDSRVYLRVMPTGKSAIGMYGTFIDPTAGYLCSLSDIPDFVLKVIVERIEKKINNPSLML